jgi:hypothetical protein
MSTFPSDIEIAQNATMSHIKNIAKKTITGWNYFYFISGFLTWF